MRSPRQPNPRPTRSCGRFQLLPQLSPAERRHLRRWIRQLPPTVAERLPRLRVRSAGEIVRVGQRVVFDTFFRCHSEELARRRQTSLRMTTKKGINDRG